MELGGVIFKKCLRWLVLIFCLLQLLAERGMTNTHLTAFWDLHKDTASPPASPTPYAVRMGF